jgi:hypothetical protein
VARSRPRAHWQKRFDVAAPDPHEDPLGYHRWWSKHVMWPAAPKTFNEFWKKVDSYKRFNQWAEDHSVRFWFDVLIQHLIDMWEEGRGELRAEPIRNGRPGRPKVQENIQFQLCVLDSVIHGLLGPCDQHGRGSQHWLESVKILKHFFPEQFPTTWNRVNLRGRVNAYIRKYRMEEDEGIHSMIIEHVSRLNHMISMDYRERIQRHLGLERPAE